MTDLEKIELAIRKVAAEADRCSSHMAYWLGRIADQIARDELERTKTEGIRR